MVEASFADVARGSGIEVRRGVRAVELLTGPEVVSGACTSSAYVTEKDVSTGPTWSSDAMGRTSPLVAWLTALGSARRRSPQDRGFMYYTRYYTGAVYPPVFGPILSPMDGFSLLTLRGGQPHLVRDRVRRQPAMP